MKTYIRQISEDPTGSGLITNFRLNINEMLENEQQPETMADASKQQQSALSTVIKMCGSEQFAFIISQTEVGSVYYYGTYGEEFNIINNIWALTTRYHYSVYDRVFGAGLTGREVLSIISEMDREAKIETIFKLAAAKKQLEKEKKITLLREKRQSFYKEIYKIGKEIKSLLDRD